MTQIFNYLSKATDMQDTLVIQKLFVGVMSIEI